MGPTNWTTGELVFDSWQGQEIFFFSTASSRTLGPSKPHIYWIWGPRFQGIKLLGTKTDRSPSYNAEAKNMWSYTSTCPYIFMTRYIIKHRNNFALILTSYLTR
jgi:hypothetical protein